MLNPKLVAHLLGVSTRTLEGWRTHIGKPTTKPTPKHIVLPNGRVAYPADSLADYMANHPRLAALLDHIGEPA
jgi:hypothetical protein